MTSAPKSSPRKHGKSTRFDLARSACFKCFFPNALCVFLRRLILYPHASTNADEGGERVCSAFLNEFMFRALNETLYYVLLRTRFFSSTFYSTLLHLLPLMFFVFYFNKKEKNTNLWMSHFLLSSRSLIYFFSSRIIYT